jgi:hypothetical protein
MKIRQAVLSVAFLGVALASFAAGTVAQGRYPEINEAEGALRNAVGHLQRANDVFGGYKDWAEWHVKQALDDLEKGKRWAASHGY